MGIIRVTDLYEGESGDAQRDKGITARRVLGVWTNDAEDNLAAILQDRRVPRPGAPFLLGNRRLAIYVTRLSAKKVRPKFWQVEVEYEKPPIPEEEKPEEPKEIPLPPVDVQYGSVKREYFSHYDVDGKHVLNTLGQRFEKPPPQYRYNRVITVTRLALWWDDARAEDIIGTCNRGPFRIRNRIYAPHEVVCTEVDAATEDFEKQRVWKVTCKFERDKLLWRPTLIANAGNLQIETAGDTKTPQYDGSGNPKLEITKDSKNVKHGKEILLRADGQPLGRFEAPHMLHFNFVIEADFSVFGL